MGNVIESKGVRPRLRICVRCKKTFWHFARKTRRKRGGSVWCVPCIRELKETRVPQ